jgi:uncharacterized protein YegL
MSQPILSEADLVFAENPESRCACVLLLDTSASMTGEPIRLLSEGVAAFASALKEDALAAKRVQVAVVSFESQVSVLHEFVDADAFTPPQLIPGQMTAMAAGIHKALDLVAEQKARYQAAGITYYRPWVFLITDGAPTDPQEVVQAAAARVRQEEAANRVAFFAVGVEGADMEKLATLSARQPVKLTGLHFREMFVWLSRSLKQVSASRPGEQVALPPPTGWGTV